MVRFDWMEGYLFYFLFQCINYTFVVVMILMHDPDLVSLLKLFDRLKVHVYSFN